MKVLITGAGGQIGRELIVALARQGHSVVATDVRPLSGIDVPLETSFPTSASDGARAKAREGALNVTLGVTLDVTDMAQIRQVFAHYRPEAVFHLAAILSARGEQNPTQTYEINQTGTYYILEACREYDVVTAMFASTIAVYGPGLPDPTPEDVPLNPTTMYGVTKASGEMLCDYYWQRFGFDVRAIRFPGVISASLPGGGTSDYALYMYLDAMRHGHYEAFCTPETRIPLMYIPDAISAMLGLFAAPRSSLTRTVYNIAAFSPTAAEIAASVSRAIPEAQLNFVSDPKRQAILDSWPKALDDGNACRDWSWRARYDLEAMTAHLVPEIRNLIAKSRAEAKNSGDAP